MKAADAETLGGKPLSSFLLADDTNSITAKDGTRVLKPKPDTAGTTSFIGKFIDASNLGNSILYDSGSAIGLNTTSPAAPLHINSVMGYRNVNVGSLQRGAYPGIVLENTTTDSSVLLSENNGLVFLTRPSASTNFAASDVRMIVTSGGKVGIGTSAPAAPLHIAAISPYRNLNLAAVQTGAYPGLLLENTTTNSSVALTENNGLGIFIRPSASTAFAGSDLRMFVSNTGNVGIGTGTPAAPLDVVGDINLSGNLLLPATASSSVGVIKIGGAPFAHKFGGTGNTFVGYNAGNFAGTGGDNNTGIGGGALGTITSGTGNTALGTGALETVSTGIGNTAGGQYSLFLATGGGNTAFGFLTLQNLGATGDSNTAIGNQSMTNLTTGSNNVAVGQSAGSNLTSGSTNLYLANLGASSESGTTRIGSNHTRAFIAGVRNVTTANANAVGVLIDSAGQLGTTSSSRRYKFDINDMVSTTEGLMRLRPVTFRYLAHGDGAPLQYGLIAEEVAEIYPELVAYKDGAPETVMYQFLAPMLLNEVQKQRGMIEQQQAENAALRARLDRLEKAVGTEVREVVRILRRAAPPGAARTWLDRLYVETWAAHRKAQRSGSAVRRREPSSPACAV